MNEVTRILSEIEPGDPRVADPRLRLDDRRFHWAGAFRMSIVRRHVRQYAWGVGFTRRHEPILLMRFLEM
jgi:hypothetical protein